MQGGNDIHAHGISVFARVLKDNSVITVVSNQAAFSSQFDVNLHLHNMHLFHPRTQLELGYNPIGPDGAKALAEVLKFHGNIKDLMLGWCQVIH